jgi:hypothetical protein
MAALIVVGLALILGAFYVGFAARPNGSPLIRRVMFLPYMEAAFPLLLMAVILTGVILIVSALDPQGVP